MKATTFAAHAIMPFLYPFDGYPHGPWVTGLALHPLDRPDSTLLKVHVHLILLFCY